jgi:hypothetical protein
MDLEFSRAKLLPEPERPEYSLSRLQENVAILAYQKLGPERASGALEYLVDHHRPMVANLALKFRVPQKFVPYITAKRVGPGKYQTTRHGKLGTLIEYGIVGLREAAKPWRESERYKDKIVGFMTGSNSRFSSYARDSARKEMLEAVLPFKPCRAPEFKENILGTTKAARPSREPPRGASDLMLDYYAGYTYEEIGKRYGRSGEWARKQIQKEFERLRAIHPIELPPCRKRSSARTRTNIA